MIRLRACVAFLFALLATTCANTEKVIFTAPPPLELPTTDPVFDALYLGTLRPGFSSIRASLKVAFATTDQSYGLDAWFLLRDLQPDQRHEVRVCWAATQPTAFRLETFSIATVFDTPELVQGLAAYSDDQRRAIDLQDFPIVGNKGEQETHESLLFLRVQAAADFFSSNRTLMHHPPDVDIDLILDPYLGNIFPKSLVPTALYTVGLAVGGWWISGIFWKRLFSDEAKPHTD